MLKKFTVKQTLNFTYNYTVIILIFQDYTDLSNSIAAKIEPNLNYNAISIFFYS